jgi:isoquinoline 1-oxidoreductase alpha subunit
MPSVWRMRDLLNLTGAKYGCGVAQFAVPALVMMDGTSGFYSHLQPFQNVLEKITHIIEGLSEDGSYPIQKELAKA